MKLLSLFSGGLDSVAYTSSFMKDHRIEGLFINYGQRNIKEIEAAALLARKMEIPLGRLDIDTYSIKKFWGNTQMVEGGKLPSAEYNPSIVIPLRNGIFLMYALSHAYSHGFDGVLIGAQCDSIKQYWHHDHPETRFPDESPLFLSLMEKAANRGVFRCQGLVKVLAPVQNGWDKADLAAIGYANLGEIIFDTWTCRAGDENQCGKCEACLGRMAAFKKAKIRDHTTYG